MTWAAPQADLAVLEVESLRQHAQEPPVGWDLHLRLLAPAGMTQIRLHCMQLSPPY